VTLRTLHSRVADLCCFAKEQPLDTQNLLRMGPLLFLCQAPDLSARKGRFPKIFYLYLACQILRRISGWKAGSVFPDLRGLTRRWTSFDSKAFLGRFAGDYQDWPESSTAGPCWSWWSVRYYRGLYELGRNGCGIGSCRSCCRTRWLARCTASHAPPVHLDCRIRRCRRLLPPDTSSVQD